MERCISLKVLGPAFYRGAVEQRLAAWSHVVPAENPEVVVLLGHLWAAELERLRAGIPACGHVGIVLVTDRHTDLLRASQLGIQVFLDEDGSEEEVQHALHAAAAHSGYCSPRLMAGLFQRLGMEKVTTRRGADRQDPCSTLSEREREVAHYAALGWKNERVAARLHMSLATVKFHLSHVYAKLGIERRGELAAFIPWLTEEAETGVS